jgi:dTDP-4-amino-4,6-dideoxygalactose transaminase
MTPEIGTEELDLARQVLESGYLTTGPMTQQFEQLIAEYLGAKHAVAVSSGTTALHLALICLGIGPGDEILVPDFTFPASANVVRHCGATPVLVDIDLATFNIDVADLEKKITPRAKVIMPVHLFGLSAAMDAITALAREHNLLVVEDAACALGAEYKGRKCGAIGDLGCFSFHPRKVITTGEGGMVITDDDEYAERLRLMRNHAMDRRNDERVFVEIGYNNRMSDVLAAVGVAQMGKLDSIIAKHLELANWYQEALSGLDMLALPTVPENCRHIYQTYAVLLSENTNRQDVIQALREAGIEANIGTCSVSAQPSYQPCEIPPNSWQAHQYALALPFHTRMAKEDTTEIAHALWDVLEDL